MNPVQEAFDRIIGPARQAFEATLANSFPDVTTGDAEPFAVYDWENTVERFAVHWMVANVAPITVTVDGEELTFYPHADSGAWHASQGPDAYLLSAPMQNDGMFHPDEITECDPRAFEEEGDWTQEVHDRIRAQIVARQLRARRRHDRNPYVGEGADGARTSAQIDREEADLYDRHDPRRAGRLESAQRWEAQARRIEEES